MLCRITMDSVVVLSTVGWNNISSSVSQFILQCFNVTLRRF